MLKTKAHEEHVITGALRVAVETYVQDAAEFTRANVARLADQFKRQAQDARDLLDRIESGELSLSPEFLSVTGRRMLERQDEKPTYAARVAQLEAEGLSTSDAQAAADAEKARGPDTLGRSA